LTAQQVLRSYLIDKVFYLRAFRAENAARCLSILDFLNPRGVFLSALLIGLTACGTAPVARVDGHLANDPRDRAKAEAPRANVPPPVRQAPLPPPPQARLDEVKYSVTVKDIPVEQLLFAISRDTKVNIDVHPGIEGTVTLNAIDQTLRQILSRVAKQVDMRYEMDGPNLVVMRDSPFLKLYRVDYVNMSRESSGSIGVQTQVVGPGLANAGGTGAIASGTQNSTQLKIDNQSKNRFWESLEKNIRDLLRETDKLLPDGSSETFVRDQSQGTTSNNRVQVSSQGTGRRTNASPNRRTETTGPGLSESQVDSQTVTQTLTFREAASVIVNPETGTISVRATGRQHERVAEFVAQVSNAASRQVLIEATVVEVVLNDNYQSGVDWSALGLQGVGYSFTQSFTGQNLTQAPFFGLQYRNPNAAVGGSVTSSIKLLDSFGNTKVLSSPRITTLNNQTAVMKVVENKVYFTVRTDITTIASSSGSTVNAVPVIAYTSTPNVVPEGFVMNVTPQIGEGDIITLNVRPSITRIVSFVRDPNPDLARANVVNQIPQIQTREFETVLRVPSGQVAVLGGLMQDSFEEKRDGLPILSRWKLIGDAVSYRNDTGRKTELVVFLRPIVIKDASIETDFAAYRKLLPDSTFFKEQEPLVPELFPKHLRKDP
jgi:MSHA biogenesis protein MshL